MHPVKFICGISVRIVGSKAYTSDSQNYSRCWHNFAPRLDTTNSSCFRTCSLVHHRAAVLCVCGCGCIPMARPCVYYMAYIIYVVWSRTWTITFCEVVPNAVSFASSHYRIQSSSILTWLDTISANCCVQIKTEISNFLLGFYCFC